MAKRIDYSKWDNIDCSSSDEDKEGARPQVTKLDAPSRIKRTSDGTLVVEEQIQHPEINPNADSSTTKGHLLKRYDTTAKIEDWSQNGGVVTTEMGAKLYWSQDRYSVCLRLSLPSSQVKGNQLQVNIENMLPFKDRHIAVGTDQKAQLNVIWTDPATGDSKMLLEGDFPHAVHASEDEELDWGIDRLTEHDSKKEVALLVITVRKAVPMEGVVIWWKRPLTKFAEIDPTQANPGDASRAKEFQNAWEEAHRQFREKIQEKKST